jgi:hypothetical protein
LAPPSRSRAALAALKLRHAQQRALLADEDALELLS